MNELLRRMRYVPGYVRQRVARYAPAIPQLLPNRIGSAIAAATARDEFVFVDYNPRDRNWGDALNGYLVEQITGRTVLSSRDVMRLRKQPTYAVIGSVLSFSRLTNTTVWGAGFISADVRLRGKPTVVAAVRGPRTAQMLRNEGVKVGADVVFGDPAILMPRYYRPSSVRKKYRLGVIPHYVDSAHPGVLELAKRDDVALIDVGDDLLRFVDKVVACEAIASSSLHGLIAADAYGVPRTWIEVSGNVTGAGFKFHDYAEGARLTTGATRLFRGTLAVEPLVSAALQLEIPSVVSDDLAAACPLPMKPGS